MVVSRHKPSSKNAAKFRCSEENSAAESSQASSVNSASRVLGYDKIDGKRKASHLMPNNALRETDRTHRSSRRFSRPSKTNGEAEGYRSAKLKAKDMVQSQRVEVGPKIQKETFDFGVGLSFLSTCAPSSTSFLFSSPAKTHDNTKAKNAEASRNFKYASRDGEEGKLGNLLQRENHPSRE